MSAEIIKESEAKMQKCIEACKRDLNSQRTGRASVAVLDPVKVDAYGTPTPIAQLGNISIPEPRMLLVNPWDKSLLSAIEKAIMEANIGLTPSNDGNVIRLPIPELTEDRRLGIVKNCKNLAEDGRISIRNVRRDFNDKIKKQEKEKEISEDDKKKLLDDVQKVTDKYIKQIDIILDEKSKEIMSV